MEIERALEDIHRRSPILSEHDADVDRLLDLQLTEGKYRKVAQEVHGEFKVHWSAIEALATVAVAELRVPAARVKAIFEEHSVEFAEGVCFDDDAQDKAIRKPEWDRLLEAFRGIA